MKDKILILVTQMFPYNKREAFLEQEIIYLSQQFKFIYIISQETDSDFSRELPDNCKAYRINSNLYRNELIQLSLASIFTKAFLIELFNILFLYKNPIKLSLIKNLIYTISAGRKIYCFIQKIIKNEHLKYNDLVFYSYWLDRSAYAISKYNNKSITISRAHGFDVYQWRSLNNYQPIKRYLYNNLDAIYFISANGKNYFEKTYRIIDKNKQKLKISRLGSINHLEFKPKIRNKNELFIVSCSGMIKLKQIDKLIESISLIDNINIRWLHIGDDPDNLEYENNIKAYASKKLANKNNIKYSFSGRFLNNELMEFYAKNNVDLFINVSSTEGLPVTFMEAMSFGIPVVAPDIGGVKEIVNDSNGILLSPNPACKEIADAIIKIYSMSDEDSAIMRKNAYQMWLENYNAEKNYQKFSKEISEL